MLLKRAPRRTAGILDGLEKTTLGNWSLRHLSTDHKGDKYKVAAIEPVNGTANYTFYVLEGKINSHGGLKYKQLRDDYPQLYREVEQFFTHERQAKYTSTSEESDPYGDLALQRKQLLTKAQNWRRAILGFRRQELEQAAVKTVGGWEAGVRVLYRALYDEPISGEKLAEVVAYITQRSAEIDLGQLLDIEKSYYAGKFKPNSSAKLEEQLNLLANNDTGFEDLEAEDGMDRRTDGDSAADAQRDTPTESSQLPAEDPFAIFL